MKFKLTKRGKIVIVCLLLIVFVLIYSLVKAVTASQSINDAENSKNVQSEIDESNTGELEDQSNLVENENTDSTDEISPVENENVDSTDEIAPVENEDADSTDEIAPVEDEDADSTDEIAPVEDEDAASTDEISPIEDENVDSTDEIAPNENEDTESEDLVDPTDEVLDEANDADATDELKNTESIENSPELLEIIVENYFEDDFSIKEDENFDELERLAQISIMNPSEVIVIEGHTNGYPNYNDGTIAYDLSNDRAQKVKEQLIIFGVLEDNIEIVVVGSSKPKNTDGTAQHLNRRAVTYFKDAQNEKEIIETYDVLAED